MQAAGPQIYQINRQNNSFQNMQGMLLATIDRLARKIDFVQKKHLKTQIPMEPNCCANGSGNLENV